MGARLSLRGLPVRQVGQVEGRRGEGRRRARRDRLGEDGRRLVVAVQGPRRVRRPGPRGLGRGQAARSPRSATSSCCSTRSPTRSSGAGSTSTTSSRRSATGPASSTSSSPAATRRPSCSRRPTSSPRSSRSSTRWTRASAPSRGSSGRGRSSSSTARASRSGRRPTALERARTPALDALGRAGRCRGVRTVAPWLPAGSEAAIPALLGWTPPAPVDRGALEAAARGIAPAAGERAWRVDVVAAPAAAPASRGRIAAAATWPRRPGAPRPPPRRPSPAARRPAAAARRGARARAARLARGRRPAADPRRGRRRGRRPGRRRGPRAAARRGASSSRPARPAAPAATSARRPPRRWPRSRRGARRVVVHVGAPDEAAHEHDADAKVAAIAAADEQVARRWPRPSRRRAHGLPRPRLRPRHGRPRRRHRSRACDGRRRGPAGRLTERAVAALPVVDLHAAVAGVIPRVVVAGTSSGAGKTSVACGLIGALRAPRPGRPGLQGRPRLHRPELPRARLGPPGPQPRRVPQRPRPDRAAAPPRRRRRGHRGDRGRHGPVRRRLRARRAGVDRARREAPARAGASSSSTPPRWRARRPRSSTATATFDPAVDVAGVIYNKVGSDHHEELLREATAPLGIPVLGALRRDERVAAPERHLGLVPADEREARARAALDALADAIRALGRPRPPSSGSRAPPRRWTARRGSPGRRPAPVPRADRHRPRSRVLLPLHGEPRAARAPPAPSSRRSTRCATRRCPTAPGARAGRRLSGGVRRRARGQRGAARSRSAPSPPPAGRCWPSAAGSCTCAPSSTATRCAACCPPAARMAGRLTLGYREAVAATRPRGSPPASACAATSSTTPPSRRPAASRAGLVAHGARHDPRRGPRRGGRPGELPPRPLGRAPRARAPLRAGRRRAARRGMSALTVVGIGADGWAGLGEGARTALRAARAVVGSPRQLALLPGRGRGAAAPAARRRWRRSSTSSPQPPTTAWRPGQRRPDAARHRRVARAAPRARAPRRSPASFGLRAGLRAPRVAGGRRRARQRRRAFAGDRSRASCNPAAGSIVVRRRPGRRPHASRVSSPTRGHGPSRFVVLERLGARDERITDVDRGRLRRTTPTRCTPSRSRCAPRRVRRCSRSSPACPTTPTRRDGQLTKRHVRSITLAALAPRPHALLWDVGAGSGSIAIEWLRAEPTAHARSPIEAAAERAERIERNAACTRRPGSPHRRRSARRQRRSPGSRRRRLCSSAEE